MISTHCSHPLLHRLALFLLTCLMLAGPVARADEVRVVSSGGFAAAYKALAPAFEKAFPEQPADDSRDG